MTKLQFEFLAALTFFVATLVFVYASLGVGALVRPRRPTRDKLRIYECGEPTIGSAWIRYNIRFYTIALVFLIFDVETVFLFPIARVFRWFVSERAGMVALVEVAAFVGVLIVALVYAWRFGNLDWISGPTNEPSPGAKQTKNLRDSKRQVVVTAPGGA